MHYDKKEFSTNGLSIKVGSSEWHYGEDVADLGGDVDPKYGTGWTGYTWNKKLFPDPKRFMNWLHEHGLKVTLNVHPADGIRPYEDLYPRVAEKMGIDPASQQSIQFDAADPEDIANVLYGAGLSPRLYCTE